MAFDWREYLEVARDLPTLSSGSYSQEAVERCAVSRAYYAAFCHARNYARQHLGFSPDYEGTDHGAIRYHLRQHRLYRSARKLDQLRIWRNRCDYEDVVPATDQLFRAAVAAADDVIDDLQI